MYPVSFVDPLLYQLYSSLFRTRSPPLLFRVSLCLSLYLFSECQTVSSWEVINGGKKTARGERPTSSIMANALDVVERLGNGMVVVSDLVHVIQVK